jgi:CheY-like chemotaxis protein
MEAENGSVAVEKLMRQDVDLIITDMNMPGPYGDMVMRAVRQGPKKPAPIIVIKNKSEK